MIRMRWRVVIPILVLLAAAEGCGSPPCFQIETAVHGDGSCDRQIWQPEREMLPAEALKPGWSAHWKAVRPMAAPPAFADKVDEIWNLVRIEAIKAQGGRGTG